LSCDEDDTKDASAEKEGYLQERLRNTRLFDERVFPLTVRNENTSILVAWRIFRLDLMIGRERKENAPRSHIVAVVNHKRSGTAHDTKFDEGEAEQARSKVELSEKWMDLVSRQC